MPTRFGDYILLWIKPCLETQAVLRWYISTIICIWNAPAYPTCPNDWWTTSILLVPLSNISSKDPLYHPWTSHWYVAPFSSFLMQLILNARRSCWSNTVLLFLKFVEVILRCSARDTATFPTMNTASWATTPKPSCMLHSSACMSPHPFLTIG